LGDYDVATPRPPLSPSEIPRDAARNMRGERGASLRKVLHGRWGSLGSIVNQFKGACTRRIRKAGHLHFAWQPRFYDHIIRTQASLQRIRTYIDQNPARWTEDKYHPLK
jgi:REP element-mobilizing transposase RayT